MVYISGPLAPELPQLRPEIVSSASDGRIDGLPPFWDDMIVT